MLATAQTLSYLHRTLKVFSKYVKVDDCRGYTLDESSKNLIHQAIKIWSTNFDNFYKLIKGNYSTKPAVISLVPYLLNADFLLSSECLDVINLCLVFIDES